MRAIPCPIDKGRFEDLYLNQKLTEREINTLLLGEGYDSSMKRVRSWRLRYGIETVKRYDRHSLPPIEGDLKSILIGSMLGDGRIAYRTSASHYEERHSPEQLPYLEWKAGYWGEWSSGEMSVAYSREFPSHIFRTKAHPALNEYRDLFYAERERGWKIVKPEVVDKVDALSLAIWYLDDGCAGHWPIICFGAKGESRGNAYLIFEKFGLTPRWKKVKGDNGQFHFRGEDAERFIDIVTPHIPDCMSYKLSFGFQGPRNAIKKRLDKETLESLLSKGWSQRKMATYLDVGTSTVARYLDKFGLK